MKVYVPMQTIEGDKQPILGVYYELQTAMNQMDSVTEEGTGSGFQWLGNWCGGHGDCGDVWIRKFIMDGEESVNEVWPMELETGS